jgi:DNA-3-methyladenine glycosylase
MVRGERLPRSFYAQSTRQVARSLLGSRLVRVEQHNGEMRRISGIITETEAYCGEEDLGCHAKAGRTKRTEVMYGPPGFSYVYFTYGMHWLLCAVTRPEGQPEAVLIRAIEPEEGIEVIEERRGKQARKVWTDGPAKLTQALGIMGEHNGLDMTGHEAIIFVEAGEAVPDSQVSVGPRIGLFTVPEPWKSKAWRYLATLQNRSK